MSFQFQQCDRDIVTNARGYLPSAVLIQNTTANSEAELITTLPADAEPHALRRFLLARTQETQDSLRFWRVLFDPGGCAQCARAPCHPGGVRVIPMDIARRDVA